MVDLKNQTVLQNLTLLSEIFDELIRRKVTRSQNSPLGDYAEKLAEGAMDLTLEGGSRQGYDATGNVDGKKYQIKARRTAKPNNSISLSVFRGIKVKQFDYLLVVVCNMNFTVEKAYKIPHNVVETHAKPAKGVNGVTLSLNSHLKSHDEVQEFTSEFQAFQKTF